MEKQEEYSLDFLIKKFESHSNNYERANSDHEIENGVNYFNLPKALKFMCEKIKEHATNDWMIEDTVFPKDFQKCFNGWISVEDKIPDTTEKVLAYSKTDKNKLYNMRHDGWFRDTIYVCRMSDNKFMIESHGPELPATHWMSLPSPPDKS
jgi:Protein of unknown function (DUF551)